MIRPCYLVVEQEFSGNISTRKLVLETAKLNVITAYSASEALATMAKFPAVDGIVLDANLRDMTCPELIRRLKAMSPSTPIVAISSPRMEDCAGADYTVQGFQPAPLLELLRTMQPEAAQALDRRNAELMDEGL